MPTTATEAQLRGTYLELLKGAVSGMVHQDSYALVPRYDGPRWKLHLRAFERVRDRLRRSRGIELAQRAPDQHFSDGYLVWPLVGETMIGKHRLDNLQWCIEEVLRDVVPGDLIETGVWRGGACIFMRGVLKAHGITDRRVWAADSFQGLPPPRGDLYPADAGDRNYVFDELAVTLETVRGNFERYGLLDDQVRFVKGWFSETLPTLRDVTWSIIRLDGDMYESTMDALTNLYPNLSPGGFVIIDDGALEGCARAVADFRERVGSTEPLHRIDWSGIWWRRER